MEKAVTMYNCHTPTYKDSHMLQIYTLNNFHIFHTAVIQIKIHHFSRYIKDLKKITHRFDQKNPRHDVIPGVLSVAALAGSLWLSQ